MAEFRITYKKAESRLTYEGPFGPADIDHRYVWDRPERVRNFVIEVSGPIVPRATLCLGRDTISLVRNPGLVKTIRR
jgi:hypothetical protein